MMRFVTNRNLGILGYPDSTEMWTNIIDHIPDSVLLNPNVKILSIACGHCTEADVIVKRLKALGVSTTDIKNRIYVLDKYRVFTNYAKLKGYTNIITCDFLEWETTMKFDVIVGNPPYNTNDTHKSNTAHRGQGINLAKKFTLKSLDLVNDTGFLFFIMPYGNRTYSNGLAEHYRKLGLYSIKDVSEYFKDVSTNPCVFSFNRSKIVNEVDDCKKPNRKIPIKNLGLIFKNQPGNLNRIDYEDKLLDSGKYRIVVTTSIQKYTNDISIVNNMNDKTVGNWRIVFNCTTSQGKFGKILIESPDSILSKSVHCLICNSKDHAIALKSYLLSDEVKQILAEVKINACNSKKFLEYIPIPYELINE